mmetsp:Transcript_18991/g.35615  ORF Transcript_18991/g.35615 Transcript_18991/m.35615 type:complete len:498 (-) Transcript_18991:106-1599(-)
MAKAVSGIRNDVLLPDAVRDYIVEHNLEKVVTSALNCVIQHMPEDPYARLAEELSKSSISAPRFVTLRPDTSVPRRLLQFHVVVATRGVNIRIHRLRLGDALLPAEKDNNLQGKDEEKMITGLQEYFATAFHDVYVDDFVSLHEKCVGFSAHFPGLESPATLALTNQLLDAGAAAMDLGCLEFLQHALSKCGCECVSPPLRSPQDLVNWQSKWPRFAIPVIRGGGPSVMQPASLRCCIAVSPVSLAPDGQLPLGWVMAVMEALKAAKAEVVKTLQGDKATASLVVDGAAHALPGGLVPTLQLARKGLEAAISTDATQAHGLLIVNAEEAWREEEGVYEVEAGKPKTLEELVEFYSELTEDGWLTMIVNPFREADAHIGAELLRARRPEIKLVQDYGEEVPELTEEIAYSCFWHLPQTLPLVLQQYAEHAATWQEAADGFGRLVHFDAAAVHAMPAIVEALLACDVQVMYMEEDMPDDAMAMISARQDEVLHRVRLAT